MCRGRPVCPSPTFTLLFLPFLSPSPKVGPLFFQLGDLGMRCTDILVFGLKRAALDGSNFTCIFTKNTRKLDKLTA